MCLLTCGQENLIKDGTVRNPPSIASLPWCFQCVLISHGLSRPTFRVFCTDQGSAAWPCPGCMDRLPREPKEVVLPLPFLLLHVLPSMSRVWRLQGVPVSDAVCGSLGCRPCIAQRGVLVQRVFLWPHTSLFPRGSAPRKPVCWLPVRGRCAGRGWCWLAGRSTDRPHSHPC